MSTRDVPMVPRRLSTSLFALVSLVVLPGCHPQAPANLPFVTDISPADRATCMGGSLEHVTPEHAKACAQAELWLVDCVDEEDQVGLIRRKVGLYARPAELCLGKVYFGQDGDALLTRMELVLAAYCRGTATSAPERQSRGQACETAGRGHRDGLGVPKHPTRALELFHAGCGHGHANSCYLEALTLRAGKGVPKDADRCAALVTRACELARKDGFDSSPGPCDDPDTPRALRVRRQQSSSSNASSRPAATEPTYIVPPTIRRLDKEERCAQAVAEHYQSCLSYCDTKGPGQVLYCKSLCEDKWGNRRTPREPEDMGDDRRCR